MNEFFDNLGKAAKDAAKMAMKVSGDAVELTKASLNIKLDESKRDILFKEIGKIVYDLHQKNILAFIAENVGVEENAKAINDLCKCVDEIEQAINEQKTKAASISNKKFCINCGEKVDKTYKFCYSCGAKQPEIVEEECDCCDEETDSCCDESSCDCGCEADEDCCDSSESCDQ